MTNAAALEGLLQGFLAPVIREVVQEVVREHLQSIPATQSNRILNIDQAAEFTGMAKQTLYQMAAQGRVPCSRRGKRLLFLEDQLIQWVKEGRKTVHP
jgi:excisionase family DNA binding protein